MFATNNNQDDTGFHEQLLAHLPNGVVVLAPRRTSGRITDFSFVFLNAAAEQMSGYRLADHTDKTLLEIFPDHLENGIFAQYVQVAESGRSQVLEYHYVRAARRPKWFRVHCVRFGGGLITSFEDISVQKQAELELRENQHFIQSVTEATPEIIYVYDLFADNNVYVNKRLEEMLGYSVREAKDVSFYSLVHPDDVAMMKNRMRLFEQASDTDVFENEFRMQAADKSWRWMYARAVVFRRTAEGKVWQIVGTTRDITTRKRIEEELRQQQHLLATIADATPDVILLVDLIEDRVVYANRQMGRSLDIPTTQFVNMNEVERRRWVLEEDLLKRTAYLRGFAEAHDNEVREVEYRIKDAQGKWKWVWTRGKVFRRLPDGRVWQIIMVGQDVTEKKENQRQLRMANAELKVQQKNLQDLNNQLEERVQVRTQELEESARRFQMLLEAIPQMAWTATPDGRINYYNQQWYRYTGMAPEAALGEGYQEVMHPEDVEISYRNWMHSVDTGEPFEQENRLKCASDGSWRWHLSRAMPIRNSAGEIALWAGTWTDTHDLKMALENLSEVNGALDNFVHMAAHDLRSPVNNLKTLFQLHRLATDPQEAAQFFKAMEESANRLDNTVQSLIEVLEVQNNYQIPAREVFFQDAVNYLMKDYAAELEGHNGKLETDFSRCPSVFYVEAYLYSIVRNLLSNAIKYRSPYRDLVLKVSSDRQDGLVVLRVSDNGIGINLKKHGKNLFNPFSRFTSQAYGKGLGLHLVKNMIEKNGGRIEVQSEGDGGTTFIVTLKEYPAG
jgi:PAS domain S-box-containing protein